MYFLPSPREYDKGRARECDEGRIREYGEGMIRVMERIKYPEEATMTDQPKQLSREDVYT
jgi:hypothetical protein